MRAVQKSPPIPLEFGTPEQFSSLRKLLDASGYTTETVCDRLGLSTMFELESLDEGPMSVEEIRDTADVLIWLFLGGKPLDRARVGRFLADAEIETFTQLGLLEAGPSDTDLQSSVLLYPMKSVYLVSDLAVNRLDGTPISFADSVYPPFTISAGWFLSMLPRTPCENFLELCGGTGVAALLMADSAAQSWSVDITERSTVFAKFNAALNDTPRFRAIQGDLYATVGDETFDRIVAHPPYMPAMENTWIFRDGGPDGEDIVRGIMKGLRAHLRPGGYLYLTAILSDREDAPVETRIRDMLGPDENLFDVAVIHAKAFHPMVHYGAALWRGTATAAEIELQLSHLRSLGIRQMVLCSVVVRRPEMPRSVFTTRRIAGPGCDADALEWLLSWEADAAEPGIEQRLADAVPRPLDSSELLVSHKLEAGDWKPVRLELRTDSPFQQHVPCGAWVAEFLRRCDGKRSAVSILKNMKEEGAVPGNAPGDDFLQMVKGLAASGFLRYDNT